MEVSEAEDAWSCPTGLVSVNDTPSHVDFLPALPAKELKAGQKHGWLLSQWSLIKVCWQSLLSSRASRRTVENGKL